jgi:hypothetical protein
MYFFFSSLVSSSHCLRNCKQKWKWQNNKAPPLAYPFIMEGKYLPAQLTFLFGKERSQKTKKG